MFRANCGKCGHLFDVVILPMPVADFVRAAKDCRCPVCGNIRGHKAGPARPLTDDEHAAKSAAMQRVAARSA